MPEIETPNQPDQKPATSLPVGGPLFGQAPDVDYSLHDLLEQINDLEDERRWARIREGIWISILLHVLVFSVITWIPRYLLHMPRVVDPSTILKNRKDLTYLDLPPDALKNIKPKKEAPPSDKNRQAQSPKPILDKKTLAELQAMAKANAPAPPPPAPAAPQQQQAQNAPPKPEFQPIPPNPQSQSQLNAPHAVPARPNNPFQLPNQSPGNAIQQAARDAAGQHNGGYFGAGNPSNHDGLKNGVDIVSDTLGVDFGPYIQKMLHETRKTWEPLIPESVRPPLYKKGTVLVQFTISPDGSVKDRSMIRQATSGDPALDRAAWGAIQGSDYPPLPKEYLQRNGKELTIRILFLYNPDDADLR